MMLNIPFYRFAKCREQIIIIAQTPPETIFQFARQICTEKRLPCPRSRSPRPARCTPRYPWRSRRWWPMFSSSPPPPPPQWSLVWTRLFSPILFPLSPSKLLPDLIDLDPVPSHISHLAESSSGQRGLRLWWPGKLFVCFSQNGSHSFWQMMWIGRAEVGSLERV